MYNKNNRAANIFVVSLLVLATAVSIGFYFSRPQTAALANNKPAQESLPASEKPADVVMPQDASKTVLSKTQNDITVEITSTKIISTGVEIGICYTTLDGGEWYPMPGHLFYGEYEVFPDEYEFLEGEILADGKNTGTRCALVRYRIEDLSTITTPLKFSVLRFYAPGREMYTPCQELQQRLDTNPKAKAYGLQAKCTQAGDGSVSLALTGNNKSVTDEKASKLLNDIAKAEVVGLWEFTITTIEK